MYFQFKTRETTYELKFANPLNFIIGDSARGKTELIKLYNKCKGVGITTDASEVITELPDRYVSSLKSGALVIVDLDDYDDENRINTYVSNAREDIFTVLIGRKWIRRFPVAITNTFRFIESNGVTKNIQFTDKFMNPGKFNKVLIEDSSSGKRFIKDALSSVIVESSNGASSIVKGTKLSSDLLCIFDEFGFGGYIESFLDKAPIDMPYIAWKSFEGFLIEEHFKGTAGYNYFNAEVNAERQLHEYCQLYSKASWSASRCNSCKELCRCYPKDIIKHSKYGWILNDKKSPLLRAAEKGKGI
jgi:hypothetical protein